MKNCWLVQWWWCEAPVKLILYAGAVNAKWLHEPPKGCTLLICFSMSFSPTLCAWGVKLKRPVFNISISISFGGYDTILNIILVGIFLSSDCFCGYLEDEYTISLFMKGEKQKKMLNRTFESSHQDVNSAVCRATSAQPPCLHALHFSSHPTPSPSSCFLWILPAALSCLCLPDSLTAHTPTSDLHQHDLPGEDQFSHFQPKCWLKERSLKRRLSDTVMTNSSLTLRSGGVWWWLCCTLSFLLSSSVRQRACVFQGLGNNDEKG